MRKITPYNILKGIRYLKHFGPREFMIRLQERMEPEEVPYGPWYANYVLTDEELARLRKKRIQDGVRFSVIVPLFHTKERFFREMADSVLASVYPNFELLLVNGSPEDENPAKLAAAYAKKDARVRVLNPGSNLGIAGNTAFGMRAAKGDFLAFLDHDDTIDPAALHFMADFVRTHPDTGVLYTDEDKISEDGKEHFAPHLKPDYNPELLRANNYICHFLAVRRDVAKVAGVPDPAYEGAQDHEFIFRCIDAAYRLGLTVGHVPEILYHWRTSAASTADNPISKQYAHEAGKRAVMEQLKREGVSGEVMLRKEPGFFRVRYPVSGEPLVSIIIPNKDEKETLSRCLDSIREKSTWKNYEIIIIENNSQTREIMAYYKSLKADPKIRICRYPSGPFNYSALNNFGFSKARGEYILLLNNDVEVITPDWIEELLGTCQQPGNGAVGCKLVYPDGTIQHAGIVIGIGGIAGSMFVDMKKEYTGYLHKADLMQNMSAVTAACMMVKAAAYRQVGGFEEKLSVAFNDVDFCLRLGEAGYRIVYDPYAVLTHYESKTRGKEDSKEKVRRFQTEIEYIRTRWTRLLKQGDPCYNKNLSLSKWNYALKDKERMHSRPACGSCAPSTVTK